MVRLRNEKVEKAVLAIGGKRPTMKTRSKADNRN